MNRTIQQTYDYYRDEMNLLLELAENSPERFQNPEFTRRFELAVDRLDTLIALYANLLANRN